MNNRTIIVAENFHKNEINEESWYFSKRKTTVKELEESGNMYIIVKNNAALLYSNNNRNARTAWIKILEKISGLALKVETDILFADQYNTESLRLLDENINEVINDKRIGMYKCSYCNHIQAEKSICYNCHKENSLESISPIQTSEIVETKLISKDYSSKFWGKEIKPKDIYYIIDENLNIITKIYTTASRPNNNKSICYFKEKCDAENYLKEFIKFNDSYKKNLELETNLLNTHKVIIY